MSRTFTLFLVAAALATANAATCPAAASSGPVQCYMGANVTAPAGACTRACSWVQRHLGNSSKPCGSASARRLGSLRLQLRRDVDGRHGGGLHGQSAALHRACPGLPLGPPVAHRWRTGGPRTCVHSVSPALPNAHAPVRTRSQGTSSGCTAAACKSNFASTCGSAASVTPLFSSLSAQGLSGAVLTSVPAGSICTACACAPCRREAPSRPPRTPKRVRTAPPQGPSRATPPR